jgi:lantibiotic modifying enzyme
MEVRKQAETAVQTTARSLTGVPGKESYSLCHGIAGNTEALIYASSVLGEPTWLRLARQTGLRGIESYHLAGADWPCGIPGGESNPSLLLGLAGIGYFYLRLIEPERFPSVLIPCSAQ